MLRTKLITCQDYLINSHILPSFTFIQLYYFCLNSNAHIHGAF
jgi:hypothetical protein